MENEEEPQFEASFRRAMVNARLAQGVSQTELARRMSQMGMPFRQQMIQRLENGTRAVRLNEAAVLSKILGFSFTANGEDDEETTEDALDEFLRNATYEAGTLVKSTNVIVGRADELSKELERADDKFSTALLGEGDEAQLKLGYVKTLRRAAGQFRSSLSNESRIFLNAVHSVKKESQALGVEGGNGVDS